MLEPGWFVFALLAAVGNGFQGWYQKVGAELRNDPYCIAFAAATVSYVAAGISLLIEGVRIPDQYGLALILGSVGALGFFAVTVCRLAALRILPTSTVFVLFRCNVLFVLGISLLVPTLNPRSTHLTALEVCGALTVVAAALVLGVGRERFRGRPHLVRGVVFSIFAALVSAILYLTQAVALHQVNMTANLLIFVVGLQVAVLTLATMAFRDKRLVTRASLMTGFRIGVCGYLAFLFFLSAVREGFLAMSVSVNSASLVIPILLASWFYHEKLTPRCVAAVVLAVVGLAVIKIGSL